MIVPAGSVVTVVDGLETSSLGGAERTELGSPRPQPVLGRRRRGRRRQGWTAFAFLAPATFLALGIIVVPLVEAVVSSFTDQSLAPRPRHWVGFRQYLDLFRSGDFHSVLKNQLVWTVGTVVAVTCLGLLLALALDRKSRGRAFFRTIVLIPWAMPTITVALIFSWLYQPGSSYLNYLLSKVGINNVGFLSDTRLALPSVAFVAVWHALPFVVIYFSAALQSLDPSLEEAALVDGAGTLRRFFSIRLPQLGPVIKTVAFLETIWMFNEFTTIWILTAGGPAGATQTLATDTYYQAFNLFRVGAASAVGTLMLLFLLVFGFGLATKAVRGLAEER
jgi:multiple sugar transport system permease protein